MPLARSIDTPPLPPLGKYISRGLLCLAVISSSIKGKEQSWIVVFQLHIPEGHLCGGSTFVPAKPPLLGSAYFQRRVSSSEAVRTLGHNDIFHGHRYPPVISHNFQSIRESQQTRPPSPTDVSADDRHDVVSISTTASKWDRFGSPALWLPVELPNFGRFLHGGKKPADSICASWPAGPPGTWCHVPRPAPG